MRKSLVLIAAILFVVSMSGIAHAEPSIEFAWDPHIPGHVENPGGTFSGQCWVDADGFTPELLMVSILDPNDLPIFALPLPGEIFYDLQYVLPQGLEDGIYTYQVEFYTAEGHYTVARTHILFAGSVTGLCVVKFIDDNGNGILDDGELLAEGWEICADGPEDLGCKFTDEDGLACWFGITPGVYHICETLQGGYVSTTGGSCADLEVFEGDINKILFGNWIPPTPTIEASWGTIKARYR